MVNIKVYGKRHSHGRKVCSNRYKKRVAGEIEPVKLYSIVECIRKAGLR